MRSGAFRVDGPPAAAAATAPAAYFAANHRAFADAAARCGLIERRVSLAGRALIIRFAGSGMIAATLPAFAHCAAAPGPADMRVEVWDSASSGVPFPLAPQRGAPLQIRGEVAGLNDGRYRTVYLTHARMLLTIDVDGQQAVVCAADPDSVPAFERACPLRVALGCWLPRHGVYLAHAAAIGTAAGALLLAGRSGAGKSTTALLGLRAGLLYLGDDICALSAGPVPAVHTLYCSAKTLRGEPAPHPAAADPAPSSHDDDRDKALYWLHPHFARQLVGTLPMRAVVLPERGSGELRLERISAVPVLRTLIPSSMALLPGVGADSVVPFARLLRGLPCYRLHLGDDRGRVAGVLAGLLAGAA